MASLKNIPLPPHPWEIITVMVVSPSDEDQVFLRHVLGHPNWNIERARDAAEARERLSSACAPVVICERDLPDGDWKDVLQEVEALDRPPLLIVVSRLADEFLWAEVLNLGGYDVLQKPFETNEVLRVISMAWRQWKSRWEPRPASSERLRAAGQLTA